MKDITTELLKADVMIGLDAFRDLIAATYSNNHGAEPIDRFLCYPDKSLGFCHTIKAVLDAPKLADHVILMTLLYLRKQGRVKAGSR